MQVHCQWLLLMNSCEKIVESSTYLFIVFDHDIKYYDILLYRNTYMLLDSVLIVETTVRLKRSC